MKVPKPPSGRPDADDASDPPESRISVAAWPWLLVGIGLGALAVFLLVLVLGQAGTGVIGSIAHVAVAFIFAFGFFGLEVALLAIGAQKWAEPTWLIAIAVGGFGFFWLVLFLEPDEGVVFALGFSLGFLFLEAMLVVISTPLVSAEPTRKRAVGRVGPVLEELEKVRLLAQRGAMPFRLVAAPIGAGACFALTHMAGFIHDDFTELELLSPWLGAAGGFALGAVPAANTYSRLYKARVLPLLIGASNPLRYQAPPKAQLQPLQTLFRFDVLKGDDALVGDYRDLPVVVAEIRALRGAFRRKTVFAGLVVEATLRNRLSGDTAIVPAPSKGEPHWPTPRGLAPVGLEDPVFERAYDVFSNDQVMARALLTQQFMERFRSLRGKPLGLGHANQLFVAIPAWAIFSPPDFDKSARDPDEIAQLQQDFAAVLRLIDSVIDLDSQTRAAAPPAPTEPVVSGRRRRRS